MTLRKKPDILSADGISRGEFLRNSARWLAGGALIVGGAVLGFRKGTEGCPPGGTCGSCAKYKICDRRPAPQPPKFPTKDTKKTKEES
ncbi:hypothetical protein JXO52_12720 [bacterium]|nr:hypothetical protein [bacterium]